MFNICLRTLPYKISGLAVPLNIFTFTLNLRQFYMPRFFILGFNYLVVIPLAVDIVGHLLFLGAVSALSTLSFMGEDAMLVDDPDF